MDHPVKLVSNLRCPQITPKPEQQGKIIWLSGAPGSGKSTTCQLMARKNGYNYYEADAILQLTNPFVDTSAENPTMAAFAGKPMRVSTGYQLLTGWPISLVKSSNCRKL